MALIWAACGNSSGKPGSQRHNNRVVCGNQLCAGQRSREVGKKEGCVDFCAAGLRSLSDGN